MSIVRTFLSHVVPQLIRPLRVLWNEVIGFVFLVLALLAAPSLYRGIRNFQGDADSLFRIVFAAIFSLVMLGFGIGSFLRARRISRS